MLRWNLRGQNSSNSVPSSALPPDALVASYNGSGWAPLKAFLETTSALVVLGQEVKVLPAFEKEATTILAKMGWKALFAPAVPGEDGRACAGVVVVAARSWLGLSIPLERSSPVLSPHRAAWALVEVPGLSPFLAVSAYLVVSEGLSQANLFLLASVGAGITLARLSFIFGADFNMELATLAKSSFSEKPRCHQCLGE